jgi:hypothetical protein
VANQEQLTLLKQGVNEWNRWRQAQPGEEVDLVYADLIPNQAIDAADKASIM